MSSAENMCGIHLMENDSKKDQVCFSDNYYLIVPRIWMVHRCNTSTLLYLRSHILIFALGNTVIEQFCSYFFIFKKTNSLSSHGYYWVISYSVLCKIVEAFFLLVVYLENLFQVSYPLLPCHYLRLETKQAPGKKSYRSHFPELWH